MKCSRCHGMMVREVIFTNQGGIPVSRCIQCGEIVDKVVILNRHRSDFPLQGAISRRRIVYRLTA